MPASSNSLSSSKLANIEYALSILSTAEHLFEVKMHIELEETSKELVLALPAWIPGSYMIRDFARNLHSLKSPQASIHINQVSKQEWKIKKHDGSDIKQLSLSYQVYAFDLSVRSAFIDDQYAFFNGTSVFLCAKGYEYCSHKVCIKHQPHILAPEIATSLKLDNLKENAYIANDYFDLIDHPFLIGQFDDHCFEVLGYRFHLVFTGSHNFDFARIERDLRPIIEHHISLFGDFPCPEYWFITLVCDNGFGGLEHLASTVLQYSRFDLPVMGEADKISKEYQQFLSLCSHELFHTWHVKRIKPEVMHQPNLFEEVYTPQLWIYEGFTSFYDDLSLARSKVISPRDYVQILNEAITRLLRNPGRLKQSACESSFDAWTKFYKQDAGSVNHIVSYYNKGAIIALCLDITLRQQSRYNVSLDNVMQVLWQQYGKTQIGTADNVILEICQREFAIDLSSFLHLATQSSIDLPLPTMLNSIGLKMNLRPQAHFQDKGGPSTSSIKHTVDLGGLLAMNDKQLKVLSIQEGRALSIAGLCVGDTIVALNKWQCDDKRFLHILNQAKLGDCLPVDVLRDGRLLTLTIEVQKAIADTCDITIENEALFMQWLGL